MKYYKNLLFTYFFVQRFFVIGYFFLWCHLGRWVPGGRNPSSVNHLSPHLRHCIFADTYRLHVYVVNAALYHIHYFVNNNLTTNRYHILQASSNTV